MLRLSLAALLLLAACDRGAPYKGMIADPPRDIPSFSYTAADGSVREMAAAKGRPMVVFFGYTHCPDVCPTTLADWKRIKAELGERANKVQFVFVSVDPERDTPEVAERYVRQYDSTFTAVSADSATTAKILAAFGAAAFRDSTEDDAGGYFVTHSAQVFLVNDKGRLLTLYPFGTPREALAADLDRLL